MSNDWSHDQIPNQLGRLFPWFKNPRRLSKSSPAHHVYEIDGGIITKLVPRADGPVGLSHEAHTLECLGRHKGDALIIPELISVDAIEDGASPFARAIRMTKLREREAVQGVNWVEYSQNVTIRIGKAAGQLHRAFDRIKGDLRERAHFSSEDEQFKKKHAVDFLSQHLSLERLFKLKNVFDAASSSRNGHVWVHGDLHWGNKVDTQDGVGLIDFEHVQRRENVEAEFVAYGPKDYDLLSQGYQSSTGITLDKRLMATYFLVAHARLCADQNCRDDFQANKAMLEGYLDRPLDFFGANVPYSLDK